LKNKAIVIGITGGIGSGKSTVSEMFEELGAKIVDADRLIHDLLDRPAIVGKISAAFGTAVLGQNGRLNRKALAEAVFAGDNPVAKLNVILHPPVIREIKRAVSKLRNGPDGDALVIDAALLMESGLDKLCDILLFVRAPFQLRAARTRRNRNMNAAEIRRREKYQLPLKAKEQKADYVINNVHSRRRTLAQVRRIRHRLYDRGNS